MVLVQLKITVGNEVLNILAEEEVVAKAEKDQNVLLQLIENARQNPVEPGNNIGKKLDKIQTSFVWPDKAALLLIELYREREMEFMGSAKRHTDLCNEIAQVLQDTDPQYTVNGVQCSNKWCGLKRTYKLIIDKNKESGSHRSTWGLFSAMDSLLRKKVSINPIAEASSDGPAPPTPSTSRAAKNGNRKKNVESILENLVDNIREEREEVKRRRTERKEEKEVRIAEKS